MSKPLDYSRFDRIARDELGGDDDDDDEGDGRVRVTRLDGPTTVTWGGGAPVAASPTPAAAAAAAPTKQSAKKDITAAYGKWDKWAREEEERSSGNEDEPREYYEDEWRRQMIQEERAKPTTTNPQRQQPTGQQRQQEAGGWTTAPLFSWRQSATELWIRFPVPPSTKAKDVAVTLSKSAGFEVTAHGRTIVKGRLLHGVWGDGGVAPLGATAEDEFQRSMEWTLEGDSANRVVAVHLFKRPAAATGGVNSGLAVWWRRVFEPASCSIPEPEVDVDNVPGRRGTAADREAAQRAWAEAHEMFRAARRKEAEAAAAAQAQQEQDAEGEE